MARKKKELPLLPGIEITDVAAEGKAIARVAFNDNMPEQKCVIFIPYGAPGDIADIKIDRKKHSYAEGHIERLIKPSEQRVTPACARFGVCGGCKWQHLPYPMQLELKQKVVTDAIERIAKVPIPPINKIIGSKEIWHYRNKMEYTFSNKKWRTWEEVKSGKEFDDIPNALGFHIPGAFDKVLHIDCCHLQDSTGDNIRNFIYDYACKNGLSFYDLKSQQGLLRTLMIRIASTGEIMVCVVFGSGDTSAINAVMESISEQFPQITSLLYVVNLKANDTIGDQDVIVFKGSEYINEEMEGLQFRINAKAFYQTNSLQAYELYRVVRRMAGLDKENPVKKPLVYDLYTGTGTIANFVARNAAQVIGVEYVPEAIEDAKVNSAVNGIDNTLFYAGDMKDVLTPDFVSAHGVPDIMIIDPPRAGMHEDVVRVILEAEPETIVYVSCNPATQARDLALLDGKYKVNEIQPVDMFPHTHHVENVIKLSRK